MSTDVIVVGAGLAGSAAAWELTGRGRSVTVLEAHRQGHRQGSSHGTSRIYRRAYGDPFYVRMTGEAEGCWDRLESEAGRTLRTRTGGIDAGGARDLPAMARLLEAAGVPIEWLSPAEATDRWPGTAFDASVLFHPDAGYLDPQATIDACLALVRARGGEVCDEQPVIRIERSANGVVVHTEAGSYAAGQVVLAAGAWLPELVPALDPAFGLPPLPELTVKQQEVFHFRHHDPSAVWPTLVFKGDVQLYGLPSGADGGPDPAMKIGQFDSLTTTTASGRDGVIDDRARTVVLDYVRHRLPGLEPVPVVEQSCLFTMTPTEDFVLDRRDRVVIASPCSGHGAKFTPLLGRLIADLVDGRPAVPRFALRG